MISSTLELRGAQTSRFPFNVLGTLKLCDKDKHKHKNKDKDNYKENDNYKYI